MNNNSIIVYRSPIEKELWEGEISGIPTFMFCILFSIVVVGVWLCGFLMWNKFIKKNRW